MNHNSWRSPYFWRRLRAMMECRPVGWMGVRSEEWYIDAGYCLDRAGIHP